MPGTRKLGRKTDHRMSMLKGMVTFLLEKGKIETTVYRAKEVSALADKMITLGKANTLAARRQAMAFLKKQSVVAKLFSVIAPVYEDRNGGYTSVLKTGPRRGDGAEMSVVVMVGAESVYAPLDKKAAKKAEKAEKAEKTQKTEKVEKTEKATEVKTEGKTVEKKPAAKSTIDKAAPKKTAVKKTAETAEKKETTAKKATPKKTTTEKAAPKKTTAAKAAPKKTTADKAAPKKTTAKKAEKPETDSSAETDKYE